MNGEPRPLRIGLTTVSALGGPVAPQAAAEGVAAQEFTGTVR
ncbi:hypothetical protein [Streptomyces tubbatahanensis]|nr:hypothetical protein [Streptomyces tubbatahanensis]